MHGWYPKDDSQGERPVADEVWELWAYLAQLFTALGSSLTKHLVSDELGCLQGRQKLGKSHELKCFGEAVNNGYNDGIICRLWEASDEVQGDMLPGMKGPQSWNLKHPPPQQTVG